MIVRTLKAMVAIRYPHGNFLCDEGNDPVLKRVCERLGVTHVTRDNRVDAKAGNINNALKQSRAEICVVLDPDHEPSPYLIDRVIGYFDDPKVGFVQSVQAYGNQGHSLIARGAAEQTYHFYGPQMMGMHRLGCTQAIGANCVFRRAALDSIGGHAAGLAEDMHTAMQLYGQGWRSVYVPEILTRGQVPSTLGAYYKQQLKWACGAWDLFLASYPRLFRRFTVAQKLHYLMTPLYYLRGLSGLIDILVPVLCLTLGLIAWRIRLEEFLAMYLPLALVALLIRAQAQRWLLEEGERGFHIAGGLLKVGTWWVYVVGMASSLLRVKIPYIPTPKDDVAEDAWGLAVPNMVAAAVSFGAIAYGLSHDWTPYSLFMAVFAGLNGVFLSAVALLGQQRSLAALSRLVPGRRAVARAGALVSRAVGAVQRGLLKGLRRWVGVPLTLAAIVVAGATASGQAHRVKDLLADEAAVHEVGGFHLGLYVPEDDPDRLVDRVAAVEDALDVRFDIVSFYLAWGPDSLTGFPDAALRSVHARGAIPMITWEPWPSVFDDPPTGGVLAAIAEGRFDEYCAAFARRVAALDGPVFIRFAHEPDNPVYPWSARGGDSAAEFIAAWRRVVGLFRREGAGNVAWVWSPWKASNIDAYYPGDSFVDWVGLTLLNYGLAAGPEGWRDFTSLYEPFHDRVKEIGKPVMLAEFGSTDYGGDRAQWLSAAVTQIADRYREIRGAVFFHTERDKTWPTTWRPFPGAAHIDWRFAGRPGHDDGVAGALRPLVARQRFTANRAAGVPLTPEPFEAPAARSTAIRRVDDGGFELLVEGEPIRRARRCLCAGQRLACGQDAADPTPA